MTSTSITRRWGRRHAGPALLAACIAFQMGRGAEAQTNAAAPPRTPPAEAAAAGRPTNDWVQRAAEQARAGQLDAAIAILDQALATDPRSAELLRSKGALQRRKGDNDSARRTYETLLETTPDDPVAKSVLALLLQDAATRAGDAEAATLLQRAAALSGYDATITAAYCLAVARLKQPEALLAAYAHLDKAQRLRPDVLAAAAGACRELERFDDAAPLYAALLAASPNDVALQEVYAGVLLRGSPNAAGDRLAEALAAHPGSIPLLRAAAQWDIDHGNRWRGLGALKRLLTLAPEDRPAASQRATLLAELGCFLLAQDVAKPLGDALDAKVRQHIASRLEEEQQSWRAIDAGLPPHASPAKLLTLCYGNVTEEGTPGPGEIDMASLVQQLEYLRGHDFRLVGPLDVAAMQRGKTPLPERAAMLVFQGAWASFATCALPALEQYGYPVVLAVPTAGIESPKTGETNPPRLTWRQLQALAQHPRVTLASMTHAVETYVQCNPQGRLAPALTSRIYQPANGRYETTPEYVDRVESDLKTSQQQIAARTGKLTDMIVWPDGAFNGVTLQLARKLDFGLMIAVCPPDPSLPADLLPAYAPAHAAALAVFARDVWQRGQPPAAVAPSFAMPVDLATVAADTPDETRANLDAMVERVVSSGADTVYLSGCMDSDGDGAAESAFFHNRTLPVKADILNHAASLLRYRGIRVVIAMPTIGIRPPGIEPDPRLFAMEYRWGRIATNPHDRRLSPFNPAAVKMISELHEDLASYVDFDGVLFGPDAHLTESEDANPLAAVYAREHADIHERNPEVLTDAQRQRRAAMKAQTLDGILDSLRKTFVLWHPVAAIGRQVSATVVLSPETDAACAQDYRATLKSYAFVCVDADPESHGSTDATDWLTQLGRAVSDADGLGRTICVIGLQPEGQGKWMSKPGWIRRIQTLGDAGFRKFAYTPDAGCAADEPPLKTLKSVRSVVDKFADQSHR